MQQKAKSKKIQSTKIGKKSQKEFSFPLEKENFMIIGLGIVVLIIGYVLMSQNSVDGFMPTIVAPILLVAGYCIIIPYGILKKAKSQTQQQAEEISPETASNVKTS